MSKPDLGSLLMSKGWLTRSELNRALALQRQVPGRLGSCLLEIDAVSEDQLLTALSEQLGVPSVPPEALRNISQEAIDLVPVQLAKRGPVIPFRLSGNRLSVALEEITDLALQDEIAFATSKRLHIHVACEARIHEALERYYGEEVPVRFARLIDRMNRSRYLWNSKASPTPPADRPLDLDTLRPPQPRPFERIQKPPQISRSLALPATEITLATLEPSAKRSGADPGGDQEAEGERANQSTSSGDGAAARQRVADADELFDDSGSQETETQEQEAETQEQETQEQESHEPEAQDAGNPEAGTHEPEAQDSATPRLKLSSEERAALEETVRRRTGNKAAGPLSERLAQAQDREEIGEVLLHSLDAHFGRSALLIAGGHGARGWKIAGEGALLGRIARLEIDFDQPSALHNLQLGTDFAVGPLADLPVHRILLDCWRRDPGEAERASWLIPVRLQGRMVIILYAEDQRAEVDAIGSLRALRWFADEAAKAFKAFILRKKSKQAKGRGRV